MGMGFVAVCVVVFFGLVVLGVAWAMHREGRRSERERPEDRLPSNRRA